MIINFYKSIDLDDGGNFLKIIKRFLTKDSKCDFYIDEEYTEIWYDTAHNGDLPYILSVTNFEDTKPPIYKSFAELEDVIDFLNDHFDIQLK